MGKGRDSERWLEPDELERDLKMLLSLANHDLQAPLRTLRSFVELAAEEHPSPFLDEALAIANRLQGLLRATLTYGRLPRHRLRTRRVELADGIESGMQRLGIDLMEDGPEVIVAGDMPPVLADRTLLGLSLEAILDNAIRFAHPERPLVVRLEAQAEGPQVRLQVADNGVGVPSAERTRCFEPTVRLHGSVIHEGHGFGLAVVRRACAMMGGTCGMSDTADGLGIAVWIALPAVPSDHRDRDAQPDV